MTRGILNWRAEDVVRFLRNHGFEHIHTRGSHMFYVRIEGRTIRQVCIPFHRGIAIKPKTLKGIINQSGVDKREWLDY